MSIHPGTAAKGKAPESQTSANAPKVRRRSPTRVNPALYLFPLPAVAVVAFFLVMPTLQAFQYAITDWNGFSAAFNYVGLDNFIRAFTKDSLFTNALTNNLKFVLLVVIAQTAFSLVLALLLTRNSRGSILLRALFFFPTILSSVSVAFIWKFIYDPNFGLANSVLRTVGVDGGAYLGNDAQALYWVAVTQVWFHSGQMMVVYIAGLQAIPRELYEAAEMDGANKWQQFKSITWPFVAPATSIVVAYTTVQSFKAFDLILGIAGNPPKAALDILSTRIYSTFANSEFGYAAAQSIIFMAMIALVTWLQRRLLRLTPKGE
ncbi:MULTISPECIES: sugar ABC transporter permease [unclassified Arthrobacter]|jgi:raffinose/stachyose/melibiose transport system permease protein|uniref:carbohydrate ABC transporter permease n=1 Tax=Micrococcaceae TaxID=1268 RepID=UPI0003701A6E|nr:MULTISPECIES: sugar ABC transporter permease [unclassified Arthrobacter]KRE75945.1 ABC transporter permease [Arthrobacter sp. Soil761]TWD48352.1 carbohydrate ABC transporter membrane protein 1 (CUT1 family) [Arthrobacter sp. AG367]BCW53540.1 sugar ABC transporter permease [Arthrobacter sp. StoSoilB19]BCW74627.1 sugar ABC transporter permease [Arthrobacter sp. NicSoilB11]